MERSHSHAHKPTENCFPASGHLLEDKHQVDTCMVQGQKVCVRENLSKYCRSASQMKAGLLLASWWRRTNHQSFSHALITDRGLQVQRCCTFWLVFLNLMLFSSRSLQFWANLVQGLFHNIPTLLLEGDYQITCICDHLFTGPPLHLITCT